MESWTQPKGTKNDDDLHCDYQIHNFKNPLCLRYFLLVHRLPAQDRLIIIEAHGEPECYADYEGKRVRLKMASRFGDVGIGEDLKQSHGYSKRVMVSDLSNFSDKP